MRMHFKLCLWKSLWRMWKTNAFQQVFADFKGNGAMYIAMHKACAHIGYFVLCRRGNRCVFSSKEAGKVVELVETTAFKKPRPSPGQEIFVKNQQNRGRYDLPRKGNT